jgi:hypothetical protein
VWRRLCPLGYSLRHILFQHITETGVYFSLNFNDVIIRLPLKFKINHLPEGTTLLIHRIGISTVVQQKKTLSNSDLKKRQQAAFGPGVPSIDIGSPLNQQRKR